MNTVRIFLGCIKFNVIFHSLVHVFCQEWSKWCLQGNFYDLQSFYSKVLITAWKTAHGMQFFMHLHKPKEIFDDVSLVRLRSETFG